MSKIALKTVEEMQYLWKYGQCFHPYSKSHLLNDSRMKNIEKEIKTH